MFKAFDELSLRVRTYLVLIPGSAVAVWWVLLALGEPRLGVRVLYIAIVTGLIVMMWMLISSFHSVDKMEKEIQEKQFFVKNAKETFGRILKETSDTGDELEKLLIAQNDEQSRKILASLKEPFAENKRVLKELESI